MFAHINGECHCQNRCMVCKGASFPPSPPRLRPGEVDGPGVTMVGRVAAARQIRPPNVSGVMPAGHS